MHFDSGLLALLFVIIALFIGALVRHLLKGSQVPYTVALLILGIAIGLAHRGNAFTDNYTLIGETLSLASEIDPHLFLFLFLPTLIFESAWAHSAREFMSFAECLPKSAVWPAADECWRCEVDRRTSGRGCCRGMGRGAGHSV
ncbi:cation:proton antiporter, partial [Vibrio vulnificus]|uniref:cation:proton antiporter domain-containing protein n=1 Tax=Vibrio vulnificus TaxID=672 RepID=UPI001EEA76F9